MTVAPVGAMAATGVLAAAVVVARGAIASASTGSDLFARTPIFQHAIPGIFIRDQWGAVEREARLLTVSPKVCRPREVMTGCRG